MNLLILLVCTFAILQVGTPAQTCDLTGCITMCCDLTNKCAKKQADCVSNCDKSCKSGCCINNVCQDSSDSCTKDSSILYFAAAIGIGLFIICIACAYRHRRIQEQRRRAAQYTNQNQNQNHNQANFANNDPGLIIPANANIAKGVPVVVEKPATFELSHISQIPYAENDVPIINEEEIKIEAVNNLFSNYNSPNSQNGDYHNILKNKETPKNAKSSRSTAFNDAEIAALKMTSPKATDRIEETKQNLSPESQRKPNTLVSGNENHKQSIQESARDPAGFIPPPNFDDEESGNLFG